MRERWSTRTSPIILFFYLLRLSDCFFSSDSLFFDPAGDVNIGPLTTTYTPAASCSLLSSFFIRYGTPVAQSSSTITEESGGSRIVSTSYVTSTSIIEEASDVEVVLPAYNWAAISAADPAADCFPSYAKLFSAYIHADTTGNAYFSPGICPSGYSTLTSTTVVDETRAYCAPTWYHCSVDEWAVALLPLICAGAIPQTDTPTAVAMITAQLNFAAEGDWVEHYTDILSSSSGSFSVLIPTQTVLSYSDMYVEVPSSSGPGDLGGSTLLHPLGVYQWVISVRHKSGDLPTIVGPGISTPASGGLSAGAQIGVGVGVGISGILAICGMVYWCLLRRRKRQQAQRVEAQQDVHTSGKAELQGTPSTDAQKYAGAELHGQGMEEMGGDWRHEVPSQNRSYIPPQELDPSTVPTQTHNGLSPGLPPSHGPGVASSAQQATQQSGPRTALGTNAGPDYPLLSPQGADTSDSAGSQHFACLLRDCKHRGAEAFSDENARDLHMTDFHGLTGEELELMKSRRRWNS
ncbi:hypothetical protein K402DRAFT_425116 [Aulographum hederae CBS 113979]|uniref:Uncharacterized protein n=1 Tax=Aulographum hederae CBS 113979 TaxID=1176131 RepID=A0A6G1GLK6_9PEZI|nr:hypothetical protein K402DRAFT_425116 [Aulographum hederae CBS 113979]